MIPDEVAIIQDGLLGSDFFKMYSAKINYAEKRLEIGRDWCGFEEPSDGEVHVIPERSEKVICISVTDEAEKDGYIPPLHMSQGVYGGKCLVHSKKRKAYMTVYNTTQKEVRLKFPEITLRDFEESKYDEASTSLLETGLGNFSTNFQRNMRKNTVSYSQPISQIETGSNYKTDPCKENPKEMLFSSRSTDTNPQEKLFSNYFTENLQVSTMVNKPRKMVHMYKTNDSILNETGNTLNNTEVLGSNTEILSSNAFIEQCTEPEIHGDAVKEISYNERCEKIEKLLRLGHLQQKERNHIREVIHKFAYQFQLPRERLQTTSEVKHRIPLINDYPFNVKQYRPPHKLREVIKKQVEEGLKGGIIRPSKSPYNLPVWVVKMKPGINNEEKWRMVIDFRKLNENTITDAFP